MEKRFLDVIEQMRINLGIPRETLGKRAGLSIAHYDKMCRRQQTRITKDDGSVEARTMLKLAEAMGCEWHLVAKTDQRDIISIYDILGTPET